MVWSRSFVPALGLAYVLGPTACGPTLPPVDDGPGTGTGTSTGDPVVDDTGPAADSTGTTTEAPPVDTGPVVDDPCWTTTPSGYGWLWGAVARADQIFAFSGDGMLTERGGVWTYDPALGMATSSLWVTPDGVWGSPDDLWLLEFDELMHWDGTTLTPSLRGQEVMLIEPTPDGTLWAMSRSPLALWRLDPGAPDWVEHAGLPFTVAEDFAANDQERWMVRAGFDGNTDFARQVGAGPWVVETIALPVDAFGARLAMGQDGALWALVVGGVPQSTWFLRRDPVGTWAWVSVPYDGQGGTQHEHMPAVHGSDLYVLRENSPSVWRWNGIDEPEVVVELPTKDAALFGREGRMAVTLDYGGPSLYELVAEPEPSLELLVHRPGLWTDDMFTTSLDAAVYGAGPRSLHRWQDGAWDVLSVRDWGGLYTGFFGGWADGPDTAWLTEVALDLDTGKHVTKIWRVLDGDFPVVADYLQEGAMLSAMWGRSSDDIYAVGADEIWNKSIWHYDGDDWSMHSAPADAKAFVAVTGDADRTFVLDGWGQVHRFQSGTWTTLPEAPNTLGATRGSMAVVAGELVVVMDYSTDAGGSTDADDFFGVWDGSAWIEAPDRWPDAPVHPIELHADGLGGVWALDDAEPPRLHYLFGDQWQTLEVPEATALGDFVAAPEGVVIEGVIEGETPTGYTFEFRWSCP